MRCSQKKSIFELRARARKFSHFGDGGFFHFKRDGRIPRRKNIAAEEFKIVVAGAIEKNLEIESDIYNIYDQPYEVWTHKITMTDPNDRNLLLTAEQFAASKGYTPRLRY